MRSNIIQMLLNASSNKGGSSPDQPSSEWTIVHLLMVSHGRIKDIRGVTFKDKSGKYYYVQAAYNVNVTHSDSSLNINGAYGFADLLPWQGAATAVTSLGSKETIDLETKDPNNRPKAICLVNYGAYGTQRNVFNTDGSNSSSIMVIGSNVSKRGTLPDGSSVVIGTDTTVAIQVPPGQIVSMTCWSDGDEIWIVQDQSMTIEENVNNWKTIGNTKLDFSRDRLMKWVPKGSKCEFFSETDDFGLTIQ